MVPNKKIENQQHQSNWMQDYKLISVKTKISNHQIRFTILLKLIYRNIFKPFSKPFKIYFSTFRKIGML